MRNGRERALVAAVLAALALGVLWVVFATGEVSMPERGLAGGTSDERIDAASVTLNTAASAPVDDNTWGIAPLESAREAVGESQGALIAERVNDLLRPVIAGTRAALVDFRVAVIAADGTRRDVGADGALHTSDLADGGLWIIEAPGVCARWLAARVVVAHRAAMSTAPMSGPLELELAPASTVVVHVEATPEGREPIQAIELTAERDELFLMALDIAAVHGVQPATREQRLDVFAGVRELLEPSLARERRRAALAALFAHPELVPTVAGHALPSRAMLAPWCERRVAGPVDSPVVFENIPSIAPIEVVVACEDVLSVGYLRHKDHERYMLLGQLRTAPLPLSAGVVVDVGVVYLPFGRVTGSLPKDALLSAKFTLVHIFSMETENGVRTGSATAAAPRVDDERNFTWRALPPGTYVFNAEWRGPGHDQNFVEHRFELAAGETFDLGVLFAPQEGALTILPHFVNVDGSPFVSSLPPERVVVSSGWIRIVTQAQWMSVQSIPLEFVDGVPTVVRGLDPADYQVGGGALVERDAQAPPCSPASGRQSCEFLSKASEMATVTVPTQTFVEVDIVVRAVGSAVVEVVVDAVVARTELFVSYYFEGGEGGTERKSGGNYEARPGDDGTTIIAISLSPSFGDWDGYVSVAVESDTKKNEWFTARGQFVVESGSDTNVRWQLQPAASLRLRESRVLEARDAQAGRMVVLADVEAPGQAGVPQFQTSSGGYIVFGGLFPRTEYIVLGTQRVTTGVPGSVVDVP